MQKRQRINQKYIAMQVFSAINKPFRTAHEVNCYLHIIHEQLDGFQLLWPTQTVT